MAKPAITVKPTNPASGERPKRTAPVAPVKPTWESAWPAKVWPRRTRKKPTKPARMATIPAAMKAVRMKSYSNISRRRHARDDYGHGRDRVRGRARHLRGDGDRARHRSRPTSRRCARRH